MPGYNFFRDIEERKKRMVREYPAGAVYEYQGTKPEIRGEIVECTGEYGSSPNYNPVIRLLFTTNTRWDNHEWRCAPKYLRRTSYKKTPDWEI